MLPEIKGNQKMKSEQNEKIAKILKRQQENVEKAKQFLLPSYLGKWVLQ